MPLRRQSNVSSSGARGCRARQHAAAGYARKDAFGFRERCDSRLEHGKSTIKRKEIYDN